MFDKIHQLDYHTAVLRDEFLQFHAKQHRIQHAITETDCGNEENFIRSLYKHHQGIVIGEQHFDGIAVDFIIDHLALFESLGVSTLFFEGMFTQYKPANDHLDHIHPEYHHMIDRAQQHGIEVIGIDSKGCKRGEGVTRGIFFNAYASHIIHQHVTSQKWLALVGMMHLKNRLFFDSTKHNFHPVVGLSELTHAASVVINPIDPHQHFTVKYNATIKAAAANMIDTDYYITKPAIKTPSKMVKPHRDKHPLEELVLYLQKHKINLTYYDIDNFTFINKTLPCSSIIFALSSPDYPQAELRRISFACRAKLHALERHDALYIEHNNQNNWIVFSSPINILETVIKVIKQTFDTL